MRSLQSVFDDIQETKESIKNIRGGYKDILDQDSEYEAVCNQLVGLRERKKAIELAAQAELGAEWDRLEDEKTLLKSLQEMMSDISINNLVDGQRIEVRDKHDRLHEPSYKVAFTKSK